MLATQLCMLCDVEICTGVLDPQGSKVAPFQYFGWLLHKPIQNDDNDDDDDDDDETNDKLLLSRLCILWLLLTPRLPILTYGRFAPCWHDCQHDANHHQQQQPTSRHVFSPTPHTGYEPLTYIHTKTAEGEG